MGNKISTVNSTTYSYSDQQSNYRRRGKQTLKPVVKSIGICLLANYLRKKQRAAKPINVTDTPLKRLVCTSAIIFIAHKKYNAENGRQRNL